MRFATVILPASASSRQGEPTPNPASQRLQLRGRMPDGRAVTEQIAVFTRGTRVYQTTVLGDKLDAQATDTFFGSLRLAP